MNDYHDYLAHYGVLGMKWGVRRYQNKDGSLTEAGKKHYGTSDPNDNKKAYELGREGTIYGEASRIASKKAQKSADRYANNPTERRRMQKEIDEATANSLREKYQKIEADAKEHVSYLKNKYGEEKVKDISYGKNGYMSEKVATGKQKVSALIASLAFSGLSILTVASGALPVGAVIQIMPRSAKELGRDEYNRTRIEERKRLTTSS